MRPDGGNGMVFCAEEPDGLFGGNLELEIEAADRDTWEITEVCMVSVQRRNFLTGRLDPPRKTFLTGYLKKDAIFYYSETLRDEIGYFVAAEYVSPEPEHEVAA